MLKLLSKDSLCSPIDQVLCTHSIDKSRCHWYSIAPPLVFNRATPDVQSRCHCYSNLSVIGIQSRRHWCSIAPPLVFNRDATVIQSRCHQSFIALPSIQTVQPNQYIRAIRVPNSYRSVYAIRRDLVSVVI